MVNLSFNWMSTFGPDISPNNPQLVNFRSRVINNPDPRFQVAFSVSGQRDGQRTDKYSSWIGGYALSDPVPERGVLSQILFRINFLNTYLLAQGSHDWFSSDDWGSAGIVYGLIVNRRRGDEYTRIYNTPVASNHILPYSSIYNTHRHFGGITSRVGPSSVSNRWVTARREDFEDIFVEPGDIFDAYVQVGFYAYARGDEGAYGGISAYSPNRSLAHVTLERVLGHTDPC